MRRAAVARGLAWHAGAWQGRRPGRDHRQCRRQHPHHTQHRDGHDPRPDDPAGFPEDHMEMTRNLRLLFLLVVTACGIGTPARTNGPYDVILKGGWIVDGSGNPRYAGDVAVSGDRIAAVGYLGGAQARDTIDVTGLVVAPGFIDMLGQSEGNVLIDNRVLSKVTQGVTTEVTGEGGSVAPLTDLLVVDDSAWMKKYGVQEDWRDLNGYFAHLARTKSAVNIATFVGATQVRLAVVGKQDRSATPEELARMVALVDTAMQQGGGRLHGARVRPRDLRTHRRGHRAREGGPAPRRRLCDPHAQRGRSDRPGARRDVPHRARGRHPGRDLAPQGVGTAQLGPHAACAGAHRLGARGRTRRHSRPVSLSRRRHLAGRISPGVGALGGE